MFFDKDGSGYIETDELADALMDDSGRTEAEVVDDILREVDTDKVCMILRVQSSISIAGYPPLTKLLRCSRTVASATRSSSR